MFNKEEFYKKSFTGEKIDLNEFIEYVNKFKNVVIWGAGNLGTAIGKRFMELNINVTCYWDVRAKDIGTLNEINVIEPFDVDYDKDSTLVIMCISNGSNGNNYYKNQLTKNGYYYFLLGMNLYQSLICPFHKGDKLIHKECLNNAVCSLLNCKKYINMIDRDKKYKDEIILQTLTFIISTKCTLKCIHCGQRLIEYPEDKVIDFPLEKIKEDMDTILDVIDAVGMISIIGGEPFIHPQLVEIVKHCLSKKNFGAINITTNGICKITSNILQQINDDRVKITFSNYSKSLNKAQKELFNKNVNNVKNSGISYSVGTPVWSMPAPIKDYQYSVDRMIDMKSKCESRRICSSVVNGKYIPCSIAEVVNGLALHDIELEYVDLLNKENLRERMKKFLDKPYYKICRYCSQEESIQIPAGVQAN